MGLKVTVLTVGKVKDKYLQLGIEEFAKRLSRFCKLELIEVKDEPMAQNASEKDLDNIREKEGLLLMSKLPDSAYVVIMDIDGKQLSSVQMAAKMKEVATYGKSHLVFVIGGSVGLSQQIKDKADLRMSFSKMR